MRTLLIIPAYNEEANLPGVVESIDSAGYDYVIVNDGSTDRTSELCRANGYNVVNLPCNLGIGGAVQAGYLYALQHGYDIAIQFDGDGQHDIRYAPALEEQIRSGADLVIGSRFLEHTPGFKSTFARRVGIKWLEILIRVFAGIKITDSTSGFRACDRAAIELFCEYYPPDYPEPESIVHAQRAGLLVREVPVEMHERQGGGSSIRGVSSAYYMIKVSLAIAMVKLARKRG